MDYSPHFRERVQALDALCDFSIALSEKIQGRKTDWRGETASLIFAKIAMACVSFLKLTPASEFCAARKGMIPWDISSASSIGRNIMEAYHSLVYVLDEPENEDERIFRRLLWEYHCDFERYEMIRIGIPDSKFLPELKESLKNAANSLRSTPHFQGLSEGFRAKLIDGKDFKTLGPVELSRKAGISELYYRSQYKYCSAFAHTAPYSISQLSAFEVGMPEGETIFRVSVERVTGYMALTIRDVAREFESFDSLPDSLKDCIMTWEGTLGWEAEEWFKEQDTPPQKGD